MIQLDYFTIQLSMTICSRVFLSFFFLTISSIFLLVWNLWLQYIFFFTRNSNSQCTTANLEFERELLGHWDNFSLFSKSQVSSPKFSQMPQPIMTWIPQWIPRKNATLLDWPHCWDCLAKGYLNIFSPFEKILPLDCLKLFAITPVLFSYNFKSFFFVLFLFI